MPLLIVVFSVLSQLWLLAGENSFKNEIVVRTIENINSRADVKRLLNLCREYGVETLSVAFKQDEDDKIPSGTLFYPSKIAPVAKGYENDDLMAYLIAEAKKASIEVNAWVPQFHDQVAYNKKKEWRMVSYSGSKAEYHDKGGREFFVNPVHPGVQEYQLSIIEEIVKRYDIDGIVLDWVRFDGYNMDLSGYTRDLYRKRYGYDPIEIDFSKEGPRRDEWNRFRSEVIADYIKRVSLKIESINPEVKLGVYILSPEWKEVAQDPALFYPYTHSLYPMCYYDDWGYEPDWIYGSREDAIVPLVIKAAHGRRVVPVFDNDWDLNVYETLFENLDSAATIGWFDYGVWSKEDFENIFFVTLIRFYSASR